MNDVITRTRLSSSDLDFCHFMTNIIRGIYLLLIGTRGEVTASQQAMTLVEWIV